MKRTIEELSRKSREKESQLNKKLEQLQKEISSFSENINTSQLDSHLSDLERTLKKKERDRPQFASLKEFLRILNDFTVRFKDFMSLSKSLAESTKEFVEAKDKEWDALSSNHVQMIFKSMEWKIDQLSADTKDANALMKRFITLKEKLNRLISVLEKEKRPAADQVQEIHQSIEDAQYAGFENRFRGISEQVKKQQKDYISYFKNADLVLDLGCGRGEFLELLQQNGIRAKGIDTNGQMIEICKDKGLDCEKADILKTLSSYEDHSLGGIFCSQVVEHLPPSYLKRMVEMAYHKLSPTSTVIIETVNPLSVFSLVQIYFLDLSHQQPVHPQTLSFLLQSSGFENIQINYSAPLENEKLKPLPEKDEATSLMNENIDKINGLLYAPSNYAAVAVKK
ncbi:MAG: methyltransferase domain-containing protein [Candidatus Aminicenantes bacterium]|nr:methyltransferase domain-containing protein [Candidatus Aminicenantes bacterium]